MKNNYLRLSLAFLLCFVVITNFAFGGGKKETTQGPTKKLTYSVRSVPTIDPQHFNAAPSSGAIKGYSEGLIQYHAGVVSPGVAERWDISADNKTMTFHLRRDAKWSDGSRLTAHDFVYAFRRLADPKNNCDYRWVLDEIVNGDEIPYGDGSIPVEQLGVSAPDDNTFVINFRVPAPYYLAFLDMAPFHPVKRELVERHGDQYAMSADKLLGNGPYIIKEYLFEQKIVYVPNPNYWNRSAIKLEEATLIIMEEDAAFAAFRNGEIDFCHIPLAVGPEFLANPSLIPGAYVGKYMTGAVDWYCINIASKTNPILGNKDFRLALNFALDREQYVKIATNGLYEPATRFVLPAVAGANRPYAQEYPMNVYKTTAEIDKAKQHLASAMRAMNISDPGQISIALKISDRPSDRMIVENCQDQWQRALGIKVNIEIVTYRAMLTDRTTSNFDLVYAGWMPDFDDPYTYLGYFTSSNTQNGGKFSNARYDELVTTANNFTNPVTRLGMYAEAEKILLEEAGLIPLQVRQQPEVRKGNLRGFNRHFLGAQEDWIYAYFE